MNLRATIADQLFYETLPHEHKEKVDRVIKGMLATVYEIGFDDGYVCGESSERHRIKESYKESAIEQAMKL